MEELQLYRELTEAAGVSGFEDEVRTLMRQRLRPYADTVETDRLGSLIACRAGQADGPRILLGAHLDEVGFMVTRITEGGFLKFRPMGGWSEQVLSGMRVNVHARGGVLPGIIGSKPPHVASQEQRRLTVPVDDLFIDIGAASRAEAGKAGVRPGDCAVPDGPFTLMHDPKFMMAKAWDNRFGCIALIETMKRLSLEAHPNVVYAVATVQEEIGLRGAVTSANKVKPDVAIALDACLAGDAPNMNAEESTSRLGGGPAIGLFDKSMVSHKRLKELIEDTAADEGIPVQYDFMTKGSTDANSFQIHGEGVPTLYLGAPARYMHSTGSILHRDDLERCVTLLTAVVRRLDRTTVNALVSY